MSVLGNTVTAITVPAEQGKEEILSVDEIIEKATGSSKSITEITSSLKEAGYQLLRSKKYNAALNHFEAARILKEDPDALCGAGKALLELARFKIKSHPGHEGARKEARNDCKRAVIFFARALVLKSDNVMALCEGGAALGILHYFKKALEAFQQAKKLIRPGEGDYYWTAVYGEAATFDALGHQEEAIQGFDAVPPSAKEYSLAQQYKLRASQALVALKRQGNVTGQPEKQSSSCPPDPQNPPSLTSSLAAGSDNRTDSSQTILPAFENSRRPTRKRPYPGLPDPVSTELAKKPIFLFPPPMQLVKKRSHLPTSR